MSRCKERLVSMPSPTADMLISLLWTTTFWVKLYIEKNYHSLWWLFCNHWIMFSNKKYIIKTEDQVYKQKYFIWDKKINTEHWLEAPSTDNFYSCSESGTSDYISSKTWSHTSYRWCSLIQHIKTKDGKSSFFFFKSKTTRNEHPTRS